MGCPSSTANGCRCWEHCPGPLVAQPTTLHVVTAGPTLAERQQDTLDRVIAEARADCPACQGNADTCRRGTDKPHFRRLTGCAAWTDAGQPQAIKAPPRPRQPWEPRPARHAA